MYRRFTILLGILCLPLASLAQTVGTFEAQTGGAFEAQHQQALAGNPADVHLKISLDSAQATFHVGETIRLKYEFTADGPGKYVAAARYFDRSQRSILETFFTAGPADAIVPLREFWDFHSAISGSHLSAPRDPTLKLDVTPQFDSLE